MRGGVESMVMRVFFDIETLPPEEAARGHLTYGTLRRLECRARSDEFGDDDLCTDEQFRQLALHGGYGRLLCIGVIVERDGIETLRGVYGRERDTRRLHLDEARTLRGFWKLMGDFDVRRDLIIGHNIYDFDVPFINQRSMICGVPQTVQLSLARYRRQPIYDTLKEWTHWVNKRSVSLTGLAKILNTEMTKTDGVDGGRVYEMFCAGRHEEIADYCLRDVEVVRAVYRKMTFADCVLERRC